MGYVIGSSPTGDWTSKPQYVAAFTNGGWRLIPPIEGMALYVKSNDQWAPIGLGRGKSARSAALP